MACPSEVNELLSITDALYPEILAAYADPRSGTLRPKAQQLLRADLLKRWTEGELKRFLQAEKKFGEQFPQIQALREALACTLVIGTSYLRSIGTARTALASAVRRKR